MLRLNKLKTSSVLKIILESVTDGQAAVECTFKEGVVVITAADGKENVQNFKK